MPSAQGAAAGAVQPGQRGQPTAPQAADQQRGSEGEARQQQQRAPAEPNPLRSLGDAMEHWRASLAVGGDSSRAQVPLMNSLEALLRT